MIIILICVLSMLNSCGYKSKYYTFETELGDTFTIEVYLSGNFKGMYPYYLIYDCDESIGKTYGSASYYDRTNEGKLPDDPISNISTVGKYGNHNFYKIFDKLFYCQKGVYMDSLPDNSYVVYYVMHKMESDCPYYVVYDGQAVSDLMKSHIFEYIYKYGEIPASDKDPYLYEMLTRYSNSDFSEEERQINAGSEFTEEFMTEWAKWMLETYYTDNAE